jgi:sugar phosphate isomerase/epimerase
MILALHSWSFRDRYKNDPAFNVFKMLDETAKMGFTAIELMTGKAGSPPAPDVGGEEPDGLRKVIRYAEKCGIRVTCLAPYNDFAFVKNEEWRLANIAYVKQWLQLAGDAGVANIRMLTGYYAEGEDPKKLEQLTEAGIIECIPYAEKANVNMAIENHNSIYMKGTEIAELIARLKSKRLTACPDPSNGFKTFFEPDCSGEVIEDVAGPRTEYHAVARRERRAAALGPRPADRHLSQGRVPRRHLFRIHREDRRPAGTIAAGAAARAGGHRSRLPAAGTVPRLNPVHI